MAKVRILQLITTSIGGAGEHVLLLSKGLDKNLFDVTVAFSPGMPLDDEFYASGLRVIPISMTRTGDVFSSAKALLSLIALMSHERFDIVQTHTSIAGALGRVAARVTGIPIVIHMIHAYASHDYVPPIKRWGLRQIERILDKLTTFYVAGSDAIRAKGLRQHIMSPDKIRRIYYALDLEKFDSGKPVDKNELRKQLGLTSDDIIIGVVGRLEEQKGITFFLDAAAEIAGQRSHVHFWIVGDGPLRRNLHDRTHRLGLDDNVHFLGWRKDIPRVMASLDILMVPSLWEAFGIVSLEAMAAWKPVVGTLVEGIPEVIEDNVNGLLVPSGDAHALAVAAQQLIDDSALRHDFGVAGRRRVESMFVAEKMIQEHQRLYIALLAKLGHK